jgi:hypothetical protein
MTIERGKGATFQQSNSPHGAGKRHEGSQLKASGGGKGCQLMLTNLHIFFLLFVKLLLHALGEMVLLVMVFIYFSYVKTLKK